MIVYLQFVFLFCVVFTVLFASSSHDISGPFVLLIVHYVLRNFKEPKEIYPICLRHTRARARDACY